MAIDPPLEAGIAKVEITDRSVQPVHDPAYVKALVLRKGDVIGVLLCVDAVAIGEIGRIGNDYLPKVRQQLKGMGIPPENVLVNASHCHSVPRRDCDALTIQAVREAWSKLQPVKIGVGMAYEDRISENRRLKLSDGSEVDMRRAYSLPPDREIQKVGPIDPQVGLLRIDRMDGSPLGLVFQFACHPIMHPPSKGNSADFVGLACSAMEDALGDEVITLFVQGCAGDINPIRYKEVNRPPEAAPLANSLAISILRAHRKIPSQPNAELNFQLRKQTLPRATDYEKRIEALEAEREGIVASLQPTNINFKTFLSLYLQQKAFPEAPSHSAQSYLHDHSLKRNGIDLLDADNASATKAYLHNIEAMEKLTRLNTNLALLKKHLQTYRTQEGKDLEIEMGGLRIGDFRLVTFPGELTVEIGLRVKKAFKAPHAYVAGYTNGYIYYTPTREQRANRGYAQEDCDCLVAPEWQEMFESTALDLLEKL